MAEVLRGEGYATFMVGKWHLCPMDEASAAGPYDNWPLQRGFDRFYGFLDGETDQFTPDLTYDNHQVEPPRTPEEGYHLTEDLVDKTLEFVNDSVSIRPDRPFFTYLALGATHAPHQAPAEYLERHRGRYDEGWDSVRDRWFARQQELGVIPPGTELAPRNPGVDPWDEMPEAQRRLAARLQEAFARLPRAHRRPDRAAGGRARADGPAGRHRHRAALRQRGQPRGRPLRGAARDEVLQLPLRDARGGDGAPRRRRRSEEPLQLPVGLGPGRQHPVQVVQVEHPRGRLPRAVHRALARGDRRRRWDPPPVPLRHRHRSHHLRAGRRRGARHLSGRAPTAARRHVDDLHVRPRIGTASPAGTACSTSR